MAASATRQLHHNYSFRNLTTRILPGLCNLRRTTSPLSRIPNWGIPGHAPTRRYSTGFCTEAQAERIRSELQRYRLDVDQSVVALQSYFSAPQNREIPHTAGRGTGIFVDPTLIVTSARVIGLISSFYDSERSAVLHDCFIARTLALTSNKEVLRTSPVAVNFARDVAVLEILNPRGDSPPPLAVANGVPDEEEVLFRMVRHANCSALMVTLPGTRRGRSGRPKAPWPFDDEPDWVDYGAFENKHEIFVSLTDIPGSPWFDSQRQVVGIGSWGAETADGCIRNYAAPPVCINSILDYARNKGPHDPIVMDRWINAHTLPDHNSDTVEENVPHWPRDELYLIYYIHSDGEVRVFTVE